MGEQHADHIADVRDYRKTMLLVNGGSLGLSIQLVSTASTKAHLAASAVLALGWLSHAVSVALIVVAKKRSQEVNLNRATATWFELNDELKHAAVQLKENLDWAKSVLLLDKHAGRTLLVGLVCVVLYVGVQMFGLGVTPATTALPEGQHVHSHAGAPGGVHAHADRGVEERLSDRSVLGYTAAMNAGPAAPQALEGKGRQEQRPTSAPRSPLEASDASSGASSGSQAQEPQGR